MRSSSLGTHLVPGLRGSELHPDAHGGTYGQSMTVIDDNSPSGRGTRVLEELPGEGGGFGVRALDDEALRQLISRVDRLDDAPSSGGTQRRSRARHLDSGVLTTETPWDRVVKWAEDLPLSPAVMFDHALLDVAQERVIAERIQAGIRAATATDRPATRSARRTIREGQRATDVLVRANLRLVRAMSTRIPSGMPEDDLISLGILGLLRATLTFDPDRGKFSTYATWWIRQSVTRGVDDTERLIRIPAHAMDRLRSSRRVEREMTAAFGRTPIREELAAECGTDAATLAWLELVSRPTLSLDDWVGNEESNSRPTDWWSILSETDIEGRDPCAEADERLCARGVLAALDRFELDVAGGLAECSAPPPIERSIGMLRLRVGLVDGEEWTLERIGERYHLTRERVRQIVQRLIADPEFRRRMAAAADISLPNEDDGTRNAGDREPAVRASERRSRGGGHAGTNRQPPSERGAMRRAVQDSGEVSLEQSDASHTASPGPPGVRPRDATRRLPEEGAPGEVWWRIFGLA